MFLTVLYCRSFTFSQPGTKYICKCMYHAVVSIAMTGKLAGGRGVGEPNECTAAMNACT